EQLVVQGPIDALGALHLVDREVWPGDVAHEQAVAGQHRPRLAAAGRVDESEGGVLGPVPGGVQRADDHTPEVQLPPVGEGFVRVVRVREGVDVDRGAGCGGQAAV